MSIRMLLTIVILCVATGRITAQGNATPLGVPDEIDQNETLRDTLTRMLIKREESEFKKLVGKAETIRETAQLLATDLRIGEAGSLARRHEKRLREIERFARQIRSESGGSDDGEPEASSPRLDELVQRLVKASERLNQSIARTSRRVVSVAVIESCSEVIDLVRLIRQWRQ
ncbi:MAG: hypothetical protein ACOYLF_18105 [Blastocatellia bacterium]|jgi:hypothetical protein